MKIISWNINGIRAIMRKSLIEFLQSAQPDIFCVQEIKISEKTRLELDLKVTGYKAYWHSAQRPGYSGTAIFVKDDFKGSYKIKNGFGKKEFDGEGRVQIMELSSFYLVNIYFPNAGSELTRLPFKLSFNKSLLKHLKKLEETKPLIVTGDYNVAHQEIDLARPKENIHSPGFTMPERAWMDDFIQAGFIDTFRELNGQKIKYSWWSYRGGARYRNVGWRIDYFCVSAKLKKRLKTADILDSVMGSDHAPVMLEITS